MLLLLVQWTHRTTKQSGYSAQPGYTIHSLRVGWRNLFSSCAVHHHPKPYDRAKHLGVCRLQKRYNFFLANNLLIAKFPRPTSHTSNTVDKLNKSKSSRLVNVFMLVLPLVCWWCCCCCLFLRQSMTVSSITMVAVVAVAARWQRQRWRWRRWPTICGESGRRRERQRSHEGVR